MIISRTPLRMSFIGGGSDLPSFYKNFRGAVLSTTINKYIYISNHPYFHKDRYLLKYSKTEEVNSSNEIAHPLIRLTVQKTGIRSGIEFSSSADVPSGTGLGSSSSFTVGCLHCFSEYNKEQISREKLADLACNIEIEELGEPIGKQDQYAAAYGGFNVIEFNTNGNVKVTKLELEDDTKKRLENNLICFYVGGTRSASKILKEQAILDSQRQKMQNKMVELVYESKKVLENGDLDGFGRLLHLNWTLKKQLATGISNSNIDKIYNKAIENGAIGGKLLGAGGTGFMVFYCHETKQKQLMESLKNLRQLNFKFDDEGSKIIYKD